MVDLLKDGRTYEEIATETGRSPSTIRSQLHSAYHRLGVKNSYQAVLECMRCGWLTWSQMDDPTDAILLRIEKVLRQIVAVADAHYQADGGALSPCQRSYLEAFDVRVRAHTPSEVVHSQLIMDRAFGALVDEAGARLPDRDRRRHLADRFRAIVDSELEDVAA